MNDISDVDLQAIKVELERQFSCHAEIQPSAIAGSPYDYLYVFLTDKDAAGAHIIISDGAEHTEPGIIVGGYRHHEYGDNVGVVTVATPEEVPGVVARCRKAIKRQGWL